MDVALVIADSELAADLGALLGQSPPLRQRHGRRGDRRRADRQRLRRVGLARQRLRDLAVVAVDRDRLDAELPALAVELRHFVDLTSEKSGSTPVVSQSIMKLIVPVGAKTVAWAFR